MIASLGMYDMPELQAANDAYWNAIRSELGRGPDHLTRSDDLWPVWQSPDLLLAQTCGYPYRARLRGSVALVGTPDYGLPDCPPAHYQSVLVARADDDRETLHAFDGARFAYNEALSQSGWAGPLHHMGELGVRPGPRTETGGHALSALAVAEGRADFAGLDALTWRMLCDHRPELAGHLRVLGRTEPTPALPYITANAEDAQEIFDAISRAIPKLDREVRSRLYLRGVVHIPAQQYLAVPTPPGPDHT